MSSAFYFLSVAWSLLFELFQLCSFFALTLLQSCFSAVHVHASVSVNELWFYPCGLPADHHCSFYIWKSCLIFFVVVVSHIHGMFVTLCGPVLHIIFPYCVSYSFRFLWDKRQKLLHWDRCMEFWLDTKTKKLHQYNVLALGRRKWNQGSAEIWVKHTDPSCSAAVIWMLHNFHAGLCCHLLKIRCCWGLMVKIH